VIGEAAEEESMSETAIDRFPEIDGFRPIELARGNRNI
jgi:hypothetical protein